MIEFAIRDCAALAEIKHITPQPTDSTTLWTLAWQSRVAAWMLRHRSMLERAVQAERHAPCGKSLQDRPLGAIVSVCRRRVGPAGYRCTIGQVRVRVTPVMAWIRDTTSWPRASMFRASARTITSYGPVSG